MGLRGSGKSTLGRALAVALNSPCTDLDERTAARLGATTAGEAFRRFGESAFRTAESAALEEMLATTPQILALGGGTPTAPGAADLIARARREGRAYVVFLDPPLDVLAARLRTETGDRPSLTGRGVVEEMEEIAARRRPLYTALADLVVGRDACDAAGELSQAAAIERVARSILTGFRASESTS
ncbi:MAG: Shikimate kinase 2 [Planctomycetota bacterium]